MSDSQYMKFAMELTKYTVGQTSPNPVVGAVLVKNGRIIGVGSHLKKGEPHAEVHAIKMAGEEAKGATLYVTLEPCCHYNRTPPCTDLIIESNIKKVVIGILDPNPRVNGKGIDKLRTAGIEVDSGYYEKDISDINRFYLHFIKNKIPYVTIKSATSLDGKIATANYESKWITSEKSRLNSHSYRSSHDAILVGVNTILKDDPYLTDRVNGLNPIRIVLDNNLRTPTDAKIIKDNSTRTIIFISSKVTKERMDEYSTNNKVEIIQVNNPRIVIRDVLERLGNLGIISILVEGGGTVIESFLQEKLVNEVVSYIAPLIIGGEKAPTFVEGNGFRTLNNAIKLQFRSIERLEEDIKIVSKVIY